MPPQFHTVKDFTVTSGLSLPCFFFFLKAQILRTVFNSETYSVSSPGACIFAGPGVPPISWSKLSQRLEASQPAVLPPGILLLPAWDPVMGKVLINQSHCCLDSSPENIALCAAEVTGPVLFPMWCNGTSSLPATPWSQLPKCHVCREGQSFCHQGKSKILARQSLHCESLVRERESRQARPTDSCTEQGNPAVSNAAFRQPFQFSSAPTT